MLTPHLTTNYRPVAYVLLLSSALTLGTGVPVVAQASNATQDQTTDSSQKSNKPEPVSYKGLSTREYQDVFDELVPKAYRPTMLTVKVVDNRPRFDIELVRMPKVEPWLARHGMSNQAYRRFLDEQIELGYAETLHSRYRLYGRTFHAAVFEKTTNTGDAIKLPDGELPEDGPTAPEYEPLDEMMRTFLKKYQVPGATLAVSRNGRLRYERGFGYSSLADKTPMPANAKMRIASISKPITAVAIVQLIEQDKLAYDDPFLTVLKKTMSINDADIVDPRLRKVTILQLLQHTGGWDRGESFDPMFRSISIANALKTQAPAAARQIIRYMLTTQKLDHDPGTKFAYSNFGYSLLGRIIEAVTGTTYESYVKKNILSVRGMNSTQLGRTLPNDRAKNEATYHMRFGETGPAVFKSQRRRAEVPRPYGVWAIEPMDAHGGYISTAADLVRFGNAFRGWDQRFDEPGEPHEPLVSRKSRYQMLAAPKLKSEEPFKYYGCGWSARNGGRRGITCWHTGLLDGCSSLLVCRNDRHCWAILFNTNVVSDGTRCAEKIDALIHSAVSSIYRWPDLSAEPSLLDTR